MDKGLIAGELIRIARVLLSGGVAVGETVETKVIRIHRYRSSYSVWELLNAGKRGKTVRKAVVWDLDRLKSDTAREIVDGIGSRLVNARSYDEAFEILGWSMKQLQDLGEYVPNVEEYKERGVDVTPAGFKPYRINGKFVSVESDYKDFSVRNLADEFNLETCISTVNGGKESVKLMYRWVKDNEGHIKNMSFDEVLRGMEKAGVKYHRYCAMD